MTIKLGTTAINQIYLGSTQIKKAYLGSTLVFNDSGGDGSLKDVVSSTVFDLDATKAASYGGSGQTWANICTVPADGAGQTAYDFVLGDTNGSSTDDPTFTGSAGSAAAYFALDGGDYFDLSSTKTAFLRDMHKTTGGSDFWIAVAFQAKASAGIQDFFATNTTVSSAGLRFRLDASERLALSQRGSATVTATLTGVNLSDATDYLVICSHSHSGNNTRFWYNGSTATDVAHTFSTTTTDANSDGTISAGGDHGTIMVSGTRIYSVAVGNAYLDNSGAAAIYTALEARHSRDYSP